MRGKDKMDWFIGIGLIVIIVALGVSAGFDWIDFLP
jgi:hypothetical protein